MEEVKVAYSLMREVERVRKFLHGRVKSPELEIAVSHDLAVILREEYCRASLNSGIRAIIIDDGVPPLAGHRIFVDKGLSGPEYRVVMVFPKQEARKEYE